MQITPEEFEQLVCRYLKERGKALDNFEITHDVQEKTHDGDYQIDIKARFQAMDSNIIVLVECKRHKSPIKREVVQILHDKIRSIGAHKGIVFSTSGFQDGAISYAKVHGIALRRVNYTPGDVGLSVIAVIGITTIPIRFSLRGIAKKIIRQMNGTDDESGKGTYNIEPVVSPKDDDSLRGFLSTE